jgi:MFS transporter, SHS family, sialic acid transporter
VQWLPLWADKMAGKRIPAAKGLTILLMSVGAIIGCFIGPWIGKIMSRRPAYFILCTVSLLSCGVLFHDYNICDGCGDCRVLGWLPLYLPELFPTWARATGQGLSYNTDRILAAVGAITQGQLVNHFGGSYAKADAVETLVYLVGMAIIWLGMETKGKPLPE